MLRCSWDDEGHMITVGSQPMFLGRHQLLGSNIRDVEKVSKTQCRVDLQSNGSLTVTSLSETNPTKVLFAHPKGRRSNGVLLNRHQQQTLSKGDRILLLAHEPTTAIEVLDVSLGAQGLEQEQQQQQQEQDQGLLPPVMLIMVGLQGSGKSTFSTSLVSQSTRPWVRVNQDTVKNGAPGTRQQCLTAAGAALQQGSNIVIDRTNITPEHRLPFIHLAQQYNTPVYCCVLNVPLKTCLSRAGMREGHEGGLQGQKAYAVVQITNKSWEEAGLPRDQEGFVGSMVCESDGDVAAALKAWTAYGTTPNSLDPIAAYNTTKPPKRKEPALGTIDKFFKKQHVDKAGAGAGGSRPPAQQAQQEVIDLVDDDMEIDLPMRGMISTATAAGVHGGGGPSTSNPTLNNKAVAVGQQQQQQKEQKEKKQANAFQLMMAASKSQYETHISAPNSASKVKKTSGGGIQSRHTFPTRGGPWLNVLAQIAADPNRHRASQTILSEDDQCIMITDKFPKAHRHALVIARNPKLLGPLDLTQDDIPLLLHMRHVAETWMKQEQSKQEGSGALEKFKFGFHSVPSMRQLHLHVITQDFKSEAMKTKKHWNSFTTSFFLPLDTVLHDLQTHGVLHYSVEDKEAFLKGPLRCHRCGSGVGNMPQLKQHIASCTVKL